MTNVPDGPSDRIPGIETRYRGTLFRSRLEAHWAAFFDLMKWRWEYEPFDADGYIPDFVLMGDDPVLVEVKPAPTLTELRDPLARACGAVHSLWRHDVLALGLAPFMPAGREYAIGLLAETVDNHDPDLGPVGPYSEHDTALWHQCGSCKITTFHHTSWSYRSRLCGHYDGDGFLNEPPLDDIYLAWAAAANLVRWKAG